MRRAGRPRAEVLLSGPFEAKYGVPLDRALRLWDAHGMPLTWMAANIESITGRTVTAQTVRRMIDRAHAAVQPVPSGVMVAVDGTATFD